MSTLTPEEQATQAAYTHLAPVWDEFAQPRQRDRYYLEFASLLPPNSAILDIGCGTAPDGKIFSQDGFRYIGIDFSLPMLREAKKSPAIRNLPLLAMNMRHLGFKSSVFDGFTAITTFMHVPRKQLPAILQETHRVLKVGAVGMIFLPHGDFEGMFGGNNDELGVEAFCACWMPKNLTQVLEESGFTILYGKETEFGLAFIVRRP